jgi:hypothetical protein
VPTSRMGGILCFNTSEERLVDREDSGDTLHKSQADEDRHGAALASAHRQMVDKKFIQNQLSYGSTLKTTEGWDELSKDYDLNDSEYLAILNSYVLFVTDPNGRKQRTDFKNDKSKADENKELASIIKIMNRLWTHQYDETVDVEQALLGPGGVLDCLCEMNTGLNRSSAKLEIASERQFLQQMPSKPGIDLDLLLAIRMYSARRDAIPYFLCVNWVLRNPTVSHLDMIAPYTRLLIRGLHEMEAHGYGVPKAAYRGEPTADNTELLRQHTNYQVEFARGKLKLHSAFTSISVDPTVADLFGADKALIYHFLSVSAVDISSVSRVPGHRELVVIPPSVFKVSGAFKVQDKVVISLSQVPNSSMSYLGRWGYTKNLREESVQLSRRQDTVSHGAVETADLIFEEIKQKSSAWTDCLRKSIADHELVCMTGIGVSCGIVKDPRLTWGGLLDAMRTLLVGSCNGDDIKPWVDADTSTKASILEKIVSQSNLDYRELLSKIMRSIEYPENYHPLAVAISNLGLPIATTNYDIILESSLNRFVANLATSKDLTRHTDVIYHVHGVWYDTDSVVLSDHDYESTRNSFESNICKLESDNKRSLLFIGCQDGIIDKHFRLLFNNNCKYTGGKHFALLRGQDCRMLCNSPIFRNAVAAGSLFPVIYGYDYNELPEFIEALCPYYLNRS